MNQVSEENQRKVNAIIARQTLINQCEDKIYDLQSKLEEKESSLGRSPTFAKQNKSNGKKK